MGDKYLKEINRGLSLYWHIKKHPPTARPIPSIISKTAVGNRPQTKMTLFSSPTTMSKPFLFSPNSLSRRLCTSLGVLHFGHRGTQAHGLKTIFKRQSSSLFDVSNKKNGDGKMHAVAADANGPLLEPQSEQQNWRKLFLSDVVVKRKREAFWRRKWNSLDVAAAGVVLTLHILCLFAPFYFSWRAFWVAFGLYVVTGLLGITLSFHRNLSHKSFKLPKWLEYSFAYCGVQALQGNPIDWVSTHRFHHQFCDSERDPHSPVEGFWFSHMSWFFDTDSVTERCGGPSNVGDLEKQPFYTFIRNTYILHPLAFAVLLYAAGGFPFLVWGMGVRIVWVFHITWLVNSACHVWGKQAWNTGDLSRNNWWVALLAFGEGWHNNHHAFEYSARHGIEWWQLDMTWYVVRFLQAMGLATDVKLPSEAQKQRMAFNP